MLKILSLTQTNISLDLTECCYQESKVSHKITLKVESFLFRVVNGYVGIESRVNYGKSCLKIQYHLVVDGSKGYGCCKMTIFFLKNDLKDSCCKMKLFLICRTTASSTD